VADAALAEAYAGYLAAEDAKRPGAPQSVHAKPPIAERPVRPTRSPPARDTDLALVTIGRLSGEFKTGRSRAISSCRQSRRRCSRRGRGLPRQPKKLLVVLNVGGVIERELAHLADAILLA